LPTEQLAASPSAARRAARLGPGPLAVYYEHPVWFERLFAELDRRGTPYVKLHSGSHFYDPAGLAGLAGSSGTAAAAATAATAATAAGNAADADASEAKLAGDRRYPVVFNRMSPSAYRRSHGQVFYTLCYLAGLEHAGIRVINGLEAFRHETSKALQLSLLLSLGLPAPRTRIIHDPGQAAAAARGLRFPVVVKPNVGGSGVGVTRYDSPAELSAAAAAGTIDLGLDHVALVQELIPARGGHITRMEVVGGKFLYGIKVFLSGETFDLCPADICRTAGGVELGNACAVEAPKAGLRVEGVTPPPTVVADAERIMRHAGIDVGGIELIVDDRDGRPYFYDINALSNFVSDGQHVVGFDPFVPLADYLEAEMEAHHAD
jgi:glutathione synthase/RimK-type ligase-like ATP-grasp enzyme